MRTSIIVLTSVAVFLTGCRSTSPHCHGGKLLCEHLHDGGDAMATAKSTGNYTLFGWSDPATRKPTDPIVAPILTRHVKHGQPLGVRRSPSGELVAVAGNEEIVLAEGRYCWHVGDDSLTTNEMVGGAVVFAGAVGVLAAIAGGIAGFLWLDHETDKYLEKHDPSTSHR